MPRLMLITGYPFSVASMMALNNGVIRATVSSGSKDNLMVMREGTGM